MMMLGGTTNNNSTGRRRLYFVRLGGRGSAVTLAETIALSLDGLPDLTRDAFYALGAFAPKPATFGRAAAEAVAETDGTTLAQLVKVNLLELEDGDEIIETESSISIEELVSKYIFEGDKE